MTHVSIRQPTAFRSFIATCLFVCGLCLSVSAQGQRDEAGPTPTTGSITGRVVTDSGQPLPNASVQLRGSQSLAQPRTATTDNEGNFQISGLDPSLYGVFAVSPAYVTPPRDLGSLPNYYRIGDSITVTLLKGAVITGTVQTVNAEPLVQTMVRAVMVRDADGQAPKYTAFQMQRQTDDRGIYRIYGLLPGTYVVGTVSRSAFSSSVDAYDADASTYAPSSTRDTAAEVTVRAGEEASGIDIRYRGEPGRRISGFVSGIEQNSNVASNIILNQISNGVRMSTGFAFQQPAGKGFIFYGVGDGDYELVAHAARAPGDVSSSEPRRLTVNGADVVGIELAVKPLGSITGRVALEKSQAAECKNKRQPHFSETLLVARRNEKDARPGEPRAMLFLGSPTKDGEFQLRNLAPGQYNLGVRFFARYWYLRSISRDIPAAVSTVKRAGAVRRQADIARDGLMLKSGERPGDITFTLAEGAASVRGKITLPSGGAIPPKLFVHLIPLEKEKTEDLLRYFSREVQADGTFSLSNLPPGRYAAVTRVAGANESQLETEVRAPEGKELRTKLRRAAESSKSELEFKPCQNIIDYSLSYPEAPPAVPSHSSKPTLF